MNAFPCYNLPKSALGQSHTRWYITLGKTEEEEEEDLSQRQDSLPFISWRRLRIVPVFLLWLLNLTGWVNYKPQKCICSEFHRLRWSRWCHHPSKTFLVSFWLCSGKHSPFFLTGTFSCCNNPLMRAQCLWFSHLVKITTLERILR